jgi:hypothetical protein
MERCNWDGCKVTLTYGGKGQPRKYCPDHSTASRRASWRARPQGGHKERAVTHYPLCCQEAQKQGVTSHGSQTIRYREWDGRLGVSAPYGFKTTVSRVGHAHVKPAKVQKCEQHKQWRAICHADGEPGIYKPGKFMPLKWQANRHTPGIDCDEGHAFEVDISAGSGECGAGSMSSRMADLATEDTRPEPYVDATGVLTERDIRHYGGYRTTSGDRLDSYFIPDRSLATTSAPAKCGYDTGLERLTREWLAEAEALAEAKAAA